MGSVASLGRIGEGALPALTRLLKDPDPDLRVTVADRLAQMGAGAERAVPELARLAEDAKADTRARDAARRALERIDPARARSLPPPRSRPRPARRQPVPDPETLARKKAEVETIVATRNLEALPDLIRQAARESNADLRHAMVAAIRSFGEDALPALEKAVAGEDPGAAFLAALTAGNLGTAGIPVLVKALETPARFAAASRLGMMGPKARSAVPALKAAMGEGPGARPDAVPAIVPVLEMRNRELRIAASRALGRIGPAARERVVSRACESLGRLKRKPEAVVPALIEVVERHASFRVRASAVTALGAFGARARAAVPVLVSILEAGRPADPTAEGRDPTKARTRRSDGQRTRRREDRRLEAESRMMTDVVIRSLGDIGPDAGVALPELRKLLRSGMSPHRAASAVALYRMGGEHAAEARDFLLGLLGSDEPRDRSRGLQSLGELALEDPSFRRYFEGALEDPDPDVERTARRLLERFGTPGGPSPAER